MNLHRRRSRTARRPHLPHPHWPHLGHKPQPTTTHDSAAVWGSEWLACPDLYPNPPRQEK
jgi:hypothetical protein